MIRVVIMSAPTPPQPPPALSSAATPAFWAGSALLVLVGFSLVPIIWTAVYAGRVHTALATGRAGQNECQGFEYEKDTMRWVLHQHFRQDNANLRVGGAFMLYISLVLLVVAAVVLYFKYDDFTENFTSITSNKGWFAQSSYPLGYIAAWAVFVGVFIPIFHTYISNARDPYPLKSAELKKYEGHLAAVVKVLEAYRAKPAIWNGAGTPMALSVLKDRMTGRIVADRNLSSMAEARDLLNTLPMSEAVAYLRFSKAGGIPRPSGGNTADAVARHIAAQREIDAGRAVPEVEGYRGSPGDHYLLSSLAGVYREFTDSNNQSRVSIMSSEEVVAAPTEVNCVLTNARTGETRFRMVDGSNSGCTSAGTNPDIVEMSKEDVVAFHVALESLYITNPVRMYNEQRNVAPALKNYLYIVLVAASFLGFRFLSKKIPIPVLTLAAVAVLVLLVFIMVYIL